MPFWAKFSLFNPLYGLQLAERELLLFALFWMLLGLVDEVAIDCTWLVLRLSGRAKTPILPAADPQPLNGTIAVFIAAWQEAEVIGATITHMLNVWPQADLQLFVGCYGNDPATIAATMASVQGDPRMRLVILDRPGPSTKADCLNRLYQAMTDDEKRMGWRFRAVIMHDAEDMVHPLALSLIDDALTTADFVQLPVRAEPMGQSRWIAGHYCDEFAEAHAKSMVVRDALGAAIPSAGVGSGMARGALDRLVRIRRQQGYEGPFAADCLTEDYELGMLIAPNRERRRFLRYRDEQGALIATRAYFPADLTAAVRQKTRWVHGIAFQSWERLGWPGKPIDLWMTLRDRRGPLTALVLATAYILLLVETLLSLAYHWNMVHPLATPPLLKSLLIVSFVGAGWRAIARLVFTTREYGWGEGLRAVMRIPVANVIAIMSGRRALMAYLGELLGRHPYWEKTEHSLHPAQPQMSLSQVAV